MRRYSLGNVFALLTEAVRPLPKAASASTNTPKFSQKTLIPAEKSSEEAAFHFAAAGSASIRTEATGEARPPPRHLRAASTHG